MKKHGFTLVELLAVLVVLAVLALIAVPMVLGTIESSKRNSFESSAKNTLDAADLYEANEQLIPTDGLSVKALEIKSKERYEGLVFVNQKGEYIVKNFTNGEYCASGTKDELVVVKGDCKNTSLEPTVTSFVVTGKTTKSVSVKVEANDDTGIMEYQYCAGSCMKEEDWVTSKENTYTYPNLKYSTEYTLYVRVINRIEKRTEKSVKATTDNLPLPTYAVSPSGWATSKTVKVTYPAGYQYSYMVLEGTVKENGTVVPVGQRRTVSGTSVTLTFESNGRMKAITSDGYNDATAADLIVSQIDTTAPTGVNITKGTVSSKSIQVTANGVDNESGITKYEFSKDNGKTWITNSSKTYTFTNLTSGTYQIKVRLTNQVGLSSEASLSVTTLSIAVPTYAVTPSGWATSKTATINVTSGYTNQFKVTSGTATYNGTVVTNNTWITISGTSAQVVFTSNGALTTQVSDGINTVAGSSLSINQIDTTAPTGVSVGKGTVTSKSIQVTANGVDNESGITKYEFSKDNGATWITNSTATYTFNNLATGTYAIKVRLTNGSGLKTEASLSIATTALTAPTYSTNTSGWTTSKTVTVTYPTGYTNQVKVTSGTATYNGTTLPLNTWYTVSGNAQIVFKTNGTMVAQVTDGVNAKAGSSLTINQIDTTAPVVNSLSIASTTTAYNALTTTITSNVTDNSGATIQMYISNSGYETGGAWENYSSSKSWNVGGSLNGAGHTIYITFKDQAGNKVNRTLSYTVYSNCSSTTTTWSGVWGACSAACGGGTQTMSGTKYDTKTGANCGADSTNQQCNTHSCGPSITLVSSAYMFHLILPVNATTAIGFRAYSGSYGTGALFDSHLDATVIKLNGSTVTFGSTVTIAQGSYGMGQRRSTRPLFGAKLTDNRVFIFGNSGYFSSTNSSSYTINYPTIGIVEINNMTPSLVTAQYIDTQDQLDHTVSGIVCYNSGYCQVSIQYNPTLNYTYNRYFDVSISGNSLSSSKVSEGRQGYLYGDPQSLANQSFSGTSFAPMYGVTNLGSGTPAYLSPYPSNQSSLDVYVGNTKIFERLIGVSGSEGQPGICHFGNDRLAVADGNYVHFLKKSGGTWVDEQSIDSDLTFMVPLDDHTCLGITQANYSNTGRIYRINY